MDHDHTGQLIFCGDAQVCLFSSSSTPTPLPSPQKKKTAKNSAYWFCQFTTKFLGECCLRRDAYTQSVWTLIPVRYLVLTAIALMVIENLQLLLFSIERSLYWHEDRSCLLLLVMEVCLSSGWSKLWFLISLYLFWTLLRWFLFPMQCFFGDSRLPDSPLLTQIDP